MNILYDKEYFGFKESAKLYVEKIYDFILYNIDKPFSKKSPGKFQKYGKKYIIYKANQQTVWYVFFDHKDNNFLVNYIFNNHSKEFPELL